MAQCTHIIKMITIATEGTTGNRILSTQAKYNLKNSTLFVKKKSLSSLVVEGMYLNKINMKETKSITDIMLNGENKCFSCKVSILTSSVQHSTVGLSRNNLARKRNKMYQK